MIKEIIYKTIQLIQTIITPNSFMKVMIILLISIYFVKFLEKYQNKEYFEYHKHIIIKIFKNIRVIFISMSIYLIVTGGTYILTEYLYEAIERDKVIDFLEQPTIDKKVYVNGIEIFKYQEIIDKLIKLEHVGHHHSTSIGEPITIVINNKEKTLRLFLYDDSSIKNELWVFREINSTKSPYVGRIHTNIFSKYKK